MRRHEEAPDSAASRVGDETSVTMVSPQRSQANQYGASDRTGAHPTLQEGSCVVTLVCLT